MRQQECSTCQGEGTIPRHADGMPIECPSCLGSGQTSSSIHPGFEGIKIPKPPPRHARNRDAYPAVTEQIFTERKGQALTALGAAAIILSVGLIFGARLLLTARPLPFNPGPAVEFLGWVGILTGGAGILLAVTGLVTIAVRKLQQ